MRARIFRGLVRRFSSHAGRTGVGFGEKDAVSSVVRMSSWVRIGGFFALALLTTDGLCMSDFEVGDLSPLLEAAGDKDVKRVRQLLYEGSDPHILDKHGNTPLHFATRGGFWSADAAAAVRVARLLINAGANVDHSNQFGKTPLFYAESTDIARLLIDEGADVNHSNNSGESALFYAAWTGSVDLVRLFIDKGANVHHSDDIGDTPLTYAGLHFFGAATEQKVEIVKLLLDEGADVGPSDLFYATESGLLGGAQALIDAGADPNSACVPRTHPWPSCSVRGDYALHMAAERDDTELVALLLRAGADPNHLNSVGKTALFLAVENESVDLISMLLNNGANPNRGEPPLHVAARKDHVEIVALLLRAGADPNRRDTYGRRPLHWAAGEDVARLLIAHNAHVNVRDDEGKTPLHFAAHFGRVEVLQRLITEGADPHYKDDSGNTLLHAAVAWSGPSRLDAQQRTIVALLDIGIDSSVRNYDGLTAGELATLPDLRRLLGQTELEVSDEMIEDLVDKIYRGLCRAYSENNFTRFRNILKNTSLRLVGREITLEEAYPYLRCNQLNAENIDLIRVTIEVPSESREAAQVLVDYFVEEAEDKAFLGKIVSCRLDFGYGCLNVFEHIERKFRAFSRSTTRTKALNDFKGLLLNNIDERDLIYDTGFCRRYVGQPPHCDC